MTSSAGSANVDPMASIATCTICLDLFEGDPRVLPCGHTNCTRCLEELRHTGNDTIECTQCRAECPLPVRQLPVNFIAKQLVDELKKREKANNNGDSNQSTTKDESDDVWTLEEGVLYRWKGWRLIRTKDSFVNHYCLFIWCDDIVIELIDDSNGWFYFFLNGRLGTLYNPGTIKYDFDHPKNRAIFIDDLHKAKRAIPSGAQTKSILSVPHASQTIQFGNWDLSSVEAGMMLVTNRKGSHRKLTIKEDFTDLASRLLRGQF